MRWNELWGYQQQDYRSWPSKIDGQEQTIRIRLNHQGNKLRVVFGNLYGIENILFDQVTLQLLDDRLQVKSDLRKVTINKKEQVTIHVGCAESVSDPVEQPFDCGDILEIKTLTKNAVTLTNGLVSYARLQQEVINETIEKKSKVFLDQKEQFRMVQENQRMFYIYGIVGIQGDGIGNVLAAFGDSLTQQGFWIDHVKQRLLTEKINNTSIINKGIGGGRMLQDTDPTADSFQRHGRAGVKRYLNDVFHIKGLSGVIISYGINDVLGANQTTDIDKLYKEIIEAYMFYAEEARLRQVPIFITTLMPMGNSGYYSQLTESLRQKVNTWIRSTQLYEGVLDFDSFVRNEKQPLYLEESFDCGDGLHLSSEGGNAIAEKLPLTELPLLG